ncbi:RES family NAD+ phosphorylase [Aeromonas caviae]|uniref:RES domain-containing protein n=1 Tax=Aeromonas caviae TaxID=648 RepID=UPI0029DC5B83|nr:RES domain-containing protein [Aeromonas caviae]MDX7787018.1 RES domain-containing protein [Aeromonas caviae]
MVDNEKYVCYICTSDYFVISFIKESGTNKHRCSYCDSRRKSISLYELAELTHKGIDLHYRRYDDDGMYPGYNRGSSAEDIISELLGVDFEISVDIHDALKENYNDWNDGYDLYSDDIVYKIERSLMSLDHKWEEVKLSLQREARFFNNSVKVFFDTIFKDINTHQTQDGENAVITIDGSTHLFRARVFDSLAKVESALSHPEKNFGPPPHQQATSGRMNATGIPVFYGATSPNIAIAEVRPAVGSYAVVARFRPTKILRILDISALDKLIPSSGSLLDPVAVKKMEISSFLRRLSKKLTMPVSGLRTDHEYLITQAVSEYLSVSETYALDGIRFRSTQQPHKTDEDIKNYNIVLFSKSSSVHDANNPQPKYLVELYETDYHNDTPYSWMEPIIREIPCKKKETFMDFECKQKTEACLKLEPDSLTIHKIEGVSYQSTEYGVRLGTPVNMGAKNYYPQYDDMEM